MLARYEGQPSCCEYCRTEGHERENCKVLERKRQLWAQKEDKQNFEARTKYPLPLKQTIQKDKLNLCKSKYNQD